MAELGKWRKYNKVEEVHKRSTNRSLFSSTLHALTHPGFLLLLEHSRVDTNFMELPMILEVQIDAALTFDSVV